MALNELMKNLQGTQFVTPLNFMAPLFAGLDKKAASALGPELPKQPPKNGLPGDGGQAT